MPDKPNERRRVKRIDCYDRSLLSPNIKHSLVIDISDGGAGLLLQKETTFFFDKEKKNQPVIAGNVHLTIFHPDSSLEDGLSINAEIVWVKHEYSKDHRKIGLKFVDLNKAQSTYISKLVDWLEKEGHYFLHCELEKR